MWWVYVNFCVCVCVVSWCPFCDWNNPSDLCCSLIIRQTHVHLHVLCPNWYDLCVDMSRKTRSLHTDQNIYIFLCSTVILWLLLLLLAPSGEKSWSSTTTKFLSEVLQVESVASGQQTPPWQTVRPPCLCTRLKCPLAAFYHGSSDRRGASSVLANSLLILSHGAISTCVWIETTVSVTLRLSLRGQGEAHCHSLIRQPAHIPRECVCVWWRTPVSERQTEKERRGD